MSHRERESARRVSRSGFGERVARCRSLSEPPAAHGPVARAGNAPGGPRLRPSLTRPRFAAALSRRERDELRLALLATSCGRRRDRPRSRSSRESSPPGCSSEPLFALGEHGNVRIAPLVQGHPHLPGTAADGTILGVLLERASRGIDFDFRHFAADGAPDRDLPDHASSTAASRRKIGADTAPSPHSGHTSQSLPGGACGCSGVVSRPNVPPLMCHRKHSWR